MFKVNTRQLARLGIIYLILALLFSTFFFNKTRQRSEEETKVKEISYLQDIENYKIAIALLGKEEEVKLYNSSDLLKVLEIEESSANKYEKGIDDFINICNDISKINLEKEH